MSVKSLSAQSEKAFKKDLIAKVGRLGDDARSLRAVAV